MDAQGAAVAVGQDLEVSAGLCGFDDAESVFLPGNLQILRIVTGDLEEHAAVRASFICLSGGVQEARTEAEASGDVLAVAHVHADGLQQSLVLGIHFDISKQCKIVARAETLEMRADKSRERVVRGWAGLSYFDEVGNVFVICEKFDGSINQGFFRRQRAFGFVLGGQLLGDDLAGFDIGLVESVDAEDGSGDGGGNFPAEEFLAQVVDVGDSDVDDGVAGFFERGDLGVLRRVRRAFETKVGEDAVVTINGGSPRFSRSTGMMPLPSLPVDSAISCSSHAPRSEMPGEVMSVILSRPALAAVPRMRPSITPGFCSTGGGGLAGIDHLFGAREKFASIESHGRGGNHAEVGERRVASANRR